MRCHSVGCGMASQNAVSDAVDYAKFRSRSHDAVIRVYDTAGNVIEMRGAPGELNKMVKALLSFYLSKSA
jgi:hypothetical protein